MTPIYGIAAGLASATRLYRRRYAREFIQFVFGIEPIRWARVRPHHVRAFIAQYAFRTIERLPLKWPPDHCAVFCVGFSSAGVSNPS